MRRWSFGRKASFEDLEARHVLSAAPVVTAVEIGSTEWSSAFYQHLDEVVFEAPGGDALGEHGYAIEAGSTQTFSLPWTNLDQVSITFDQDVYVDINDLSLTGVNQTQYAFDGFIYDPQTRVATWTLASPIGVDRLMIDLNADGIDPIINLVGMALDGDWVDGVSTFNSGDGAAGGDFEFTFGVNHGDVDRTDWVEWFDYHYMNYYAGNSIGDAGYDPLYDLDGDGSITTAERDFVWSVMNTLTPQSAPAGATNNAPTANETGYLLVNNSIDDFSLSLHNVFEDAEDPDSALTYSVDSNDSPGLFDSLSIDSSTGQLRANAASGASGRATVTVSGTDTGGMSTSTDVTIDVNRTNSPPIILSFWATQDIYISSTWTIYAAIVDYDDDVIGWNVQVVGVINERAVINENGWVELVVIVDPATYGQIFLVVTDPHGAGDVAQAQIGYS